MTWLGLSSAFWSVILCRSFNEISMFIRCRQKIIKNHKIKNTLRDCEPKWWITRIIYLISLSLKHKKQKKKQRLKSGYLINGPIKIKANLNTFIYIETQLCWSFTCCCLVYSVILKIHRDKHTKNKCVNTLINQQ